MSYHIDRTYYDKNGAITTKEADACAKIAEKEVSGTVLGERQLVVKYFVKYSGYLYDPVNMTQIDVRYRTWNMREVPKRVFDMYLDFLKTKREHFRINAERLINAQP